MTPIPLPERFKFIELMKTWGAETIYDWWKMQKEKK